jgi:S-adenosylmethionine synthetase
MGVRRDRDLTLTIALAFVDRFVPEARSYFSRKEEMRQALTEYLTGRLHALDRVAVQLNTLDDASRGEGGMYLTVLGTSAEGGDCGQVGRGNRVNGVMSLNRPMSAEAAAGKNPVSHVGKIYTLLTHHIAGQVVQHVPGVAEVYVWLCSQIGQPIDAPWIAAAQVVLQDGVALPDVQPAIEAVMTQQLADVHDFEKRLARGEWPVW